MTSKASCKTADERIKQVHHQDASDLGMLLGNSMVPEKPEGKTIQEVFDVLLWALFPAWIRDFGRGSWEVEEDGERSQNWINFLPDSTYV